MPQSDFRKSKPQRWHVPGQPMLVTALVLSIPAFYLVLSSELSPYQGAGRWLYTIVALLMGMTLLGRYRSMPVTTRNKHRAAVDVLIFLGAILSAWPQSSPWPFAEWLLRLVYCAIVFLRLASLLSHYVMPHRLLQIAALALVLLAVAGEGFLLLEPRVHSYADGVWLAFLTAATLGYGELVPSTPGSRIFAVFVVLLGYALFSVFTASIAAILIGEDERKLRRELHLDTRMLRLEISALRNELREGLLARNGAAKASQSEPGGNTDG